MPICKVWIYRLLFVCLFVCLFVRLSISLPRIKLAASNFARRFIGVQGRESLILVNFAPPEVQIRTNRPARHHLHDVLNDYRLAPEYMLERIRYSMTMRYTNLCFIIIIIINMDKQFVKSRGVWT